MLYFTYIKPPALFCVDIVNSYEKKVKLHEKKKEKKCKYYMGFLTLFEAFCWNFSLNANISFLKSVYVHYSGIRCLLKVLVYDNKASSCFFYRGKNFNWLTILVVQLVFLLAFISISKVLYSMCVCKAIYQRHKIYI